MPPPNPPVVKRYYPALSSVVTLDDFPESLGFIKQGLQSLFSKIHYKDLQYKKSPKGDAAFYSLTIVSQKLAIELFGSGVSLVINPDETDNGDFNISAFPVTLEYQWKILAYLRSFDLNNFSFTPQEFFELGLIILNVSEEQALAHFINTFTVPADEDTLPLEQFVQDLKDYNDDDTIQDLGLTINEDTKLTEVAQAIHQHTEKYATLYAFGAYLLKNDVDETKKKLGEFFKKFVPDDIESYIKDILIPKARVTLTVSAAIEFPRSILYPYVQNGLVWERAPESSPLLTRFYFGKVLLYADTQEGIGYKMDLVGNLQPTYSEIGKTGLLIQLEKLKLDLSDKVNIPEADADGRPENFRGVYADALSVTLPSKWFKTPANATGSTLRIGGYNLLIGTGGLSGTFALEAVPTQNASDGQITDFFSSKFSFIYPIKGIRNNTTSNQEEVVEITNSAGLLTYLNSLTNKNLYSFKYPLQLIPNGGTTIIEFNNQEQFRTYITDIVLQENGTLWFNLGKSESRSWRIGFNRFDITFKQNQVVSSHLHAQLELKKFKKEGQSTTALVDLVGEWESEENFKLSASFSPEPLSLNLFDLLTIKFQGVEVGKDDGDFFITADTKIAFPPSSLAYSMFNGQEIDLPAIRFYFDGRFEIVGGNAFIPLNFSIKILDTFEMSVTGIHLGSVQRERNGIMRKYNYIGFDGGLSIDPIGVDVRGKGVKYYYTIDNDEPGITDSDSYFHIGTLELDLIIPGTASPSDAVAIIKGSLTIPEPGVSSEYSGKISIKLPQANIYGEASMRLNPKYPAYLIDASVDFPVPIPLGPVGINGFRGLIGQRYVAEKRAIQMTDENSWYEYYMAPTRGINYQKFSGPEATKDYETAFSVGVGATISTMDGGGRTASLRAMVLLSLPSMFAIDAGLTILSERLGLAEDDPTLAPFYAFVIIGDDSLEFGAGANFQLNKSKGWVLDIRAELQAGFFFRNQRPWYINFGTRQNPITATLFKDVLSLRAYSFLMLSASGIEAGARVDFEFNFFIAKLHASIEVGGFVSFERPQIGGYVKAQGDLKIDFWIFKLTAHIFTYFRVEIPKPFLIYAEIRIRVCARIKLGFIRLTICIPLKFVLKWQKNNIIDYTPVPALTYLPVIDADYSKDVQTANFVKGIHMMTFETFELDYLGVNINEPNHSLINKIIPLDTYVDIKVEKGLNPSPVSNKIGGHTGGAVGFVELIPPKQQQPGGHTLNQVKHKYSIEEITIKAWSETTNQWVDYHPFRAVLPPDFNSNNLKIGYWQKNNNQYDTIRLLSTNPFSFLDGAEPGWFIPEQYGITPTDLFCTSTVLTETCCNVLNKTLGTTYYPPGQYEAHYINGVYFNIKGYYEDEYDMGAGGIPVQVFSDNTMVVSNVPNVHGFAQSLEFKNFNILVITLPESSAKVDLKISTFSQGVTIRYYRTQINDASLFQSFQLIEEVYKTSAELATAVSFDNTAPYDNLRNVLKIEIIPDSPNIDEIYSAQEELAELMNSAEEASQGGTAVILTQEQLALYNELVAKIDDLKSLVCDGSEGSPCEIDELLCALYNQLLSMYADCFLTYEEKFIYTYCRELSCFHDFIKLIELFHQNNPQYQLLTNYIKQQYLLYNEQLGQLSAWCGQQNPDTETVFNFYNSFLSNTMTMINMIGELGNCNCTGGEILNCSTSIQSVCWTTLEDFEFNQTIPSQAAVQQDTGAMIDGMQATAQPIWRPNTTYYIKFKLKDEVDNGQRPPGEFNYFYGFKTVGPVGHFHKYPNAYTLPANSSVGEYPLTSLGKYLDYERSYPNADGSLLQSKPLFYGNEQCRIDLFFEKSFAYHMLNTWRAYTNVGDPTVLLPEIKGAMHIAIKDPISDVIIPYPLPVDWELSDSVPETIGNGDNGISWVNDEDPRIPINIQILNNYINLVNANSSAIQCSITLGEPIRPASYTYSVTLTNLKPRKLYTALVYNAFDENGDGLLSNQVDPVTQEILYEESQKVHEYVFQTSRYANFREQVESYKLKEYNNQGAVVNEKEAIYEVIVSLTPEQVNDAYTLISGETNAALDAMKVQFYHDFDRAIEGVFGLKPSDPPTTTDFIRIKNSVSGNIIALLIRNPEPFNNPKMPLDIAADTIQIVTDTQVVNMDYKVLYSKDYSQAIIMHISQLFDENINIRFRYKIWNGRQYIIPNIDPVTNNIIDVTKDIGIIDIDNLQIINS